MNSWTEKFSRLKIDPPRQVCPLKRNPSSGLIGFPGLEEISAMVNCMGAVAAEDNAPVRGILIAKGFSDEAVNSARVVKDLKLITCRAVYSFEKEAES